MATDTHKSIIANAINVPQISVLARECFTAYDRIVCLMITKMCMLLNVKEGLKPEQIDSIPALIVNEFGFMRLNDIQMCCNYIATGKFKIFERLDVETFFRCLREYDAMEERITAREQYNKQGHLQNEKPEEIIKMLPVEVKSQFKRIGKGQTIKDAKTSMRRAMERLKQEKEVSDEEE